MFKTYPLRNGISRLRSVASSLDYLAYTTKASIMVCVAMELLYSLLYHIRFAYQIASLKVLPVRSFHSRLPRPQP